MRTDSAEDVDSSSIFASGSEMSPSVHPTPARRVQALRRGINLSHWYSQVFSRKGYIAEHFQHYIQESDIALIAQMGFDHVRFPIACEPMLQAGNPSQLPASYIDGIRSAIETLHIHGLAVIVDIHPDAPFKEALSQSDRAVADFITFWETFADLLSAFDPERTFFEILNEPCIKDDARWNSIQDQAIRSIRRVSPDHTIIASGNDCSQIPALLKLDAPADRNVIYNFHLYDPIAFTHQGASWSPPWAMHTKGLTYPVRAAEIAPLLSSVSDEKARLKLVEYRDLNWSTPVYQAFITPAIDWASTHGVALTCNEFGVYRDFSPRASRLAWIADLSHLLTKNDIGWTMWDYAGSFATATGQPGQRVPDKEVVKALGLP